MDKLRAIGEWLVRRKYLSAFVALLLIAGAVAIYIVRDAYAGQLSDPIQRGKITDTVYGIGTVTAYRRFSFNPQVSNTVVESFVMEGDSVQKGVKLLKTDAGAIHYAPFDGIVNFFPYRNGENAYPTAPMMIVTDMHQRYILVSMEQQGAMQVRVGQKVKISFDSLRDKVFDGEVSAVYSYSGNFYARITGLSLPDFILPDMTCDVAIVVGVHENAILIPVAAFVKGNVWVKRGRAIPRLTPVKLGIVDATVAEVIEGDVQPGDQVVIRPKVGS